MSRPRDRLVPRPIHPGAGRKAGRRGIGQRLSLAAAYLSYASALACLGALGFWVGDLGVSHPVIASLGAAVVFFVGAGVVLHVMGLTKLPNLSFSREDDEPPGA